MKAALFALFSLTIAFAARERIFAESRSDAGKTPEIKIALIGDTEAGADFGSVLKLAANERADALMINGDFGYGASPEKWKDRVMASVDTDRLPIIGTLGNHDVSAAAKYIAIFNSFRTQENGLQQRCTGTTGMPSGLQCFCTSNSYPRGFGAGCNEPLSESGVLSSPAFSPETPINASVLSYHGSISL